jgi:hypothetical protein
MSTRNRPLPERSRAPRRSREMTPRADVVDPLSAPPAMPRRSAGRHGMICPRERLRSALDSQRCGIVRAARAAPAQVAQLVEQRTENPRVGGSIPSLGTNQIVDLKRPAVRQAFFVASQKTEINRLFWQRRGGQRGSDLMWHRPNGELSHPGPGQCGVLVPPVADASN